MKVRRHIDAIWRDDVDAVRDLVLKHPRLMREMARGTASCNWGPPMSYAANLGRDRIIAMLRDLGADDFQFAFDRACLQGQLDTARLFTRWARIPRSIPLWGPRKRRTTLGCHADHSLALHGTPLAGATLLHLCVDNDEIEITRWLIERGADANARAAIDSDGFGGHTALFGCVVSQSYRVGLRRDDGSGLGEQTRHAADRRTRRATVAGTIHEEEQRNDEHSRYHHTGDHGIGARFRQRGQYAKRF